MTLHEYLTTSGIRAADMAQRLRCPSNTFSQWVRGLRMPEPAMLIAIERETQGRVTATDMARQRVAYIDAVARGDVPPRRTGVRGRRRKDRADPPPALVATGG